MSNDIKIIHEAVISGVPATLTSDGTLHLGRPDGSVKEIRFGPPTKRLWLPDYATFVKAVGDALAAGDYDLGPPATPDELLRTIADIDERFGNHDIPEEDK